MINDDMLVLNKDILFSPRIFAYFGYSKMGDAFQPVFSDRLDDLLLPEGYVLSWVERNLNWDVDTKDGIFVGKLFTPPNWKPE